MHLQVGSRAVRLGDESGGLEGRGDPRVERDGGIVLSCEPLVPLSAALGYPLLERLPDAGVDHVADIRPRHLANLAQDWERVDDVCVGEPEVQDVGERQAVVLRDIDHLDVVAVDGLNSKVTSRIELSNLPF